jgi:ABC-type dipeptide/oligopeptide/nickel transport system permease subunit
MTIFKIVRSEIISLKQTDFIVTSRNLGLSNIRVLFREMIPLMLSPIIVSVVFQFANVIIAEAALSYLGIGLGNIYPSWGAMIQQGQYYLSDAWWISLFPCLLLFITLMTINSLGKNLETNLNPQL